MIVVNEAIAETIRLELSALDELLARANPRADFAAIRTRIGKQVSDGVPATEVHIENWVHFLTESSDQLERGYAVCVAFYLEAERISQGDPEAASEALKKGRKIAVDLRFVVDNPSKPDRTELGKLGARAKNDAFDVVRRDVAKLLKTLRPVGGWVSKQDAIRTIRGSIEHYAEGPERILSKNNLDRTLRKWLSAEPLRSVYDENAKGAVI